MTNRFENAVREWDRQSTTEQIRNVLFMAGPQWGHKSPEDIIRALDAAGYVIVSKDRALPESVSTDEIARLASGVYHLCDGWCRDEAW